MKTLIRIVCSFAVSLLGLFVLILGLGHFRSDSLPAGIALSILGLVTLAVAISAIWQELGRPKEADGFDEGEDVEPGDLVALCTTCLAPVDPLRHYCPKCGDAVGRYTGYIPFVDIPFRYNFLGRVWHQVWRAPGISPKKRVGQFVVMCLIAPGMVLLGLPFALLGLLRRHPMATDGPSAVIPPTGE